MIATLESDPLAMYTLEGQKEVILTAEFAGAWWKVMVDARNEEKRRNVDLKTTRSISEHSWSDEHGAKVNSVEKYNYPLQTAIYSEIDRLANGRPEYDWWPFYIVAVSKESVPDKAVVHMHDSDRYISELGQIKANMPRILTVKSHKAEPIRCEKCDYCRSTKKLAGAVYYKNL